MEACAKNLILQGRKDLPTNSDRVQAPVVSAGPTDFGGDQVHKHLSKNSRGDIITRGAAEHPSAFESAEEAHFQNLVKHVKEAHIQMEKVTNTQKGIKDALIAAVAIIRRMTSTREAIKKAGDDFKVRATSEAALIEKRQADIQTPKTTEKRKRSEDTPTPPECNPMRPKSKAPNDDSDSWTEVKTRKNKGHMTTVQRTTDAVAARKTTKPKRRVRPDALVIKPGCRCCLHQKPALLPMCGENWRQGSTRPYPWF